MLLRLLNLSQKQRQFWYWVFVVLSVIAFLLIIMVSPCVTQVGWQKQVYDETEQLKIVMMVMFPFFFGIVFSLLSDMFRIYTTEDAIRQVEIMSDYGKILTEDRQLFQKRIYQVQQDKEIEAAHNEAKKQELKLERDRKAKEFNQMYQEIVNNVGKNENNKEETQE